MKTTKIKKEIILPALRANMGDWIYYISFMRMKDIADRISFAEEIHTNESLNDLLQRRLTERSKEIVQYLKTQEQRFFNSIIVGVYGGSPRWYELSVSKNIRFDPKNLPDYLESTIGFLLLDGNEKLFAIDGQHRVAAIHKAITVNDSLKKEEVAIIFVSAKKDRKNIVRTRRLFSTLNRYAKPVKLADIISLDEDDAIAIITRRIIEEYKLFSKGTINTEAKGKNIPVSDKRSITTIVALYESLDIYLCNKNKTQWKIFKTLRPSDETLNDLYLNATKFWNSLVNFFEELKSLKPSINLDVSHLRHSNGGHLLFRPVGLLAIAHAVKMAKDNRVSLNKAIKRISAISMDLSNSPWSGLLWDDINKSMITRKENQTIAAQLLFYMIGGNLSKIKMTEDKLKKKYAGLINRPEKEVVLPEKVVSR